MKYREQESSILEYKITLPKNDQVVKTIIGFCNRNGGRLVIGIENNGDIVGIDEEKIQDWMEYLDKMIYESSAPPIIPLIHSQRVGEKTLLIIEVSSGMNKPYYHKSEGLEKGTYIRLGRSTLRADADMIEELKWLSRGRSFDTMPVYHAKEEEMDMNLIQAFLKAKKMKKTIVTKALLSSYHLVIEEHAKRYPTTAGLLLFGFKPEHHFSEAFIICSHFSGISGREAIATLDCTGTLFQQFDTAFDFIVSRLPRSFVIEGKKRKEELEIPEVAIREILLNAIVHRNYHIKAPIKVAIYENRIEVFSPGDFPGPLNSQNLRMGLTYIRNIAICKIFREAGYIEKLGSGFISVFRSYEKRGLKEPQIIEGENFVKCILPREISPVKKEDGDKQKILELFNVSERITMSDVIEILELPRATAGRRLGDLTKQGILQKIGVGKASSYKRVQ